MEKVSIWMKIGKFLGISSKKFQRIQEKSQKNIEKIQFSLMQAQEKMRNFSVVTSECLEFYSNYIEILQSGFEKQSDFISIHSLKVILQTIQRKIQIEEKERNLKRLFIACTLLKAALAELKTRPIKSIVLMSLFELDLHIEQIQNKRKDLNNFD